MPLQWSYFLEVPGIIVSKHLDPLMGPLGPQSQVREDHWWEVAIQTAQWGQHR